VELPVNYDFIDWIERKKVREEYIKVQEGKCYWCHAPLDEEPPAQITNLPIRWDLFPPAFLANSIHLQHNHATSMTEGAVHGYCNAVMWQYHGR